MTDELPKEFEIRVTWINSKKVRATKWLVHIPIKINGEEKVFSYDNGVSKFTLYVSKSNWDIWTDKGKNGDTDSLKLSSWGQRLLLYERKTYAKNYVNVWRRFE